MAREGSGVYVLTPTGRMRYPAADRKDCAGAREAVVTTIRIGLVGLLVIATTGCAGMWDEVTSREFRLKNVFSNPDPYTVVKDSTDGDARAKAYRRITEPRASGGSEIQQDETLKMLASAASTEKQSLCRLAAIQSLGRFKDPRAVPAIITAYQSADQMAPDVATAIKCQAVTALGETKQKDALPFLAQVARAKSTLEMNDRDRQFNRDVQSAAVRSLKNFKDSPEAADLALAVLSKEKDVAICDRAKEAYVAITGKEPVIERSPPANPNANPIQQAAVKGQ